MRRKTGNITQDTALNSLLAISASTTEVVYVNNVITTDHLKKLLGACGNLEERQRAVQKISENGDTLKERPASNWSSFDNWGSGGSKPLIPNSTIQAEFAAIFQALGRELDNQTQFGVTYIFRRNALYHGHLVHNATKTEDFLIFHASEYPTDLEEIKAAQSWSIEEKNTFNYSNSRTQARTTGTHYKPFASADAINKLRSSVYSITNNKLWILNFRTKMPSGGHTFKDLIDTRNRPESTLWLNECYVGDNYTDVNYFPNEEIEPFFKYYYPSSDSLAHQFSIEIRNMHNSFASSKLKYQLRLGGSKCILAAGEIEGGKDDIKVEFAPDLYEVCLPDVDKTSWIKVSSETRYDIRHTYTCDFSKLT